jgi:hypothetical protein
MACERSALKNIRRKCGANAPSIGAMVYYTPMSEFVTRPIGGSDGVSVSAFSLIAGGKFQTVELSNKKGAYKGGGKEGGYFEPQITCNHPKVNAESTSGFQAMLNTLYAVIFPDNNGQLLMCLDMEFEYDPNIDDSQNGYEIKFMGGKQGTPLLHVATGTIIPL